MMEAILNLFGGKKRRETVIKIKMHKKNIDKNLAEIDRTIDRMNKAVLNGEADWMRRCWEDKNAK
jgi:hypothetical protein